jgi:ABC-2 type transport system permease protein
LQTLDERGWRRGFANLLRKENGEWWRTRRWWMQLLLWLLIINGIMVIVLWISPAIDPAEAGDVVANTSSFTRLMAWFPMFAVIVLAQGAIVGEKQSGTAAWILSAPVSRSSFILAKFIAHAIGFLVTVVVAQGAVAYAQLSLAERAFLPVGPFVAHLALLGLYLLFYLALTLMLGTLFDARGPVLGIAIAVAIASMIGLGQAIAGFLPWLILLLPEAIPALIAARIQGAELPSAWPLPIVLIAVYTLLFLGVAVWRFRREEF